MTNPTETTQALLNRRIKFLLWEIDWQGDAPPTELDLADLWGDLDQDDEDELYARGVLEELARRLDFGPLRNHFEPLHARNGLPGPVVVKATPPCPGFPGSNGAAPGDPLKN